MRPKWTNFRVCLCRWKNNPKILHRKQLAGLHGLPLCQVSFSLLFPIGSLCLVLSASFWTGFHCSHPQLHTGKWLLPCFLRHKCRVCFCSRRWIEAWLPQGCQWCAEGPRCLGAQWCAATSDHTPVTCPWRLSLSQSATGTGLRLQIPTADFQIDRRSNQK